MKTFLTQRWPSLEASDCPSIPGSGESWCLRRIAVLGILLITDDKFQWKQVGGFLLPPRMFYMSLITPSCIAQQYSPPQFWECVFSHLFPWGATLLFNLVVEISLEFSITLGMPTVCTIYTSNSFCFAVWDTPQQGQQFWANWPKVDMVDHITRMKMGSWITSMRLRIISPKGKLPKEISGIFHWHLYFHEGFL